MIKLQLHDSQKKKEIPFSFKICKVLSCRAFIDVKKKITGNFWKIVLIDYYKDLDSLSTFQQL
jgi:hypothetical protein